MLHILQRKMPAKAFTFLALCTLLLFFVFGNCASLSPPSIFAEQWKKADDYFNKKLYQEALKEYEMLLPKLSVEERYQAIYKIAESKVLLFRFSEAAQDVVRIELPSDPIWRGRFLLLKAELYREFLKQYGYSLGKDVISGADDVIKKTPNEIHDAIKECYNAIKPLRDSLLKRPLVNESYFLDLENIDNIPYPTFWDFAVFRWTEYLLNEAASLNETANLNEDPVPYFQDKFSDNIQKYELNNLPPERLAAIFMEEAATIGGKNRSESQEFWKIKRLLIPIEHSHKFSWADNSSGNSTTALSFAVSTLKKWMESFKSIEAKSEAGYWAASILSSRLDKHEESLSVCKAVINKWPDTRGAKKCRKLQAQILFPSISLNVQIEPNIGSVAYVISKNIKELYFRLYQVTPEELSKDQKNKSWSQVLNHPGQELIKTFISKKRPVSVWQKSVDLPKPSYLYKHVYTKIPLPKEDNGLYLLLASGDEEFMPGKSLLQYSIVNFSDLILIGTSGIEDKEENLLYLPGRAVQRKANVFRFYTMNPKTGVPKEASLSLYLSRYNGAVSQNISLNTDNNGKAQLPFIINLSPYSDNYVHVDPLARSGKDFAYWNSPLYFNFQAPSPIQLFVETDRPIYRPGQKVHAKITAVMRIPEGFKTYDGKSKIKITVSDSNGQELYKEEKTPNAFGSIATSFVIPGGRLLGEYTILASISDWGYTADGSANFAVEEYKRPEFEVLLNEGKGVFKFGESAKIEGDVKYYFGGAVPNAPVIIKVFRQSYIPYFAWWWSFRDYSSDKVEVLRKEIKSDEAGHFIFTFVPQSQNIYEENPPPANFLVVAEGRDAGGRTIVAQKSYLAGKTPYLFDVQLPGGFFKTSAPAIINTRLVNLNDQNIRGDARYEVYEVLGDPKDNTTGSVWPESPDVHSIFKDQPVGKLITSGKVLFNGEDLSQIKITGLREGAYRLKLNSLDSGSKDYSSENISQSINFLVINDKSPKINLKIPSIAISNKKEYEAGETARFIIGSSYLDKGIFVEVWGGEFLLSHYFISDRGIVKLDLPISKEHKGGFTLRWFGMKDFKLRSGSVLVRVPWKEKNLNAKLIFERKIKPGQKVNWGITVLDKDKKAVNGEALVTMYDRSLEYYAESVTSGLLNIYTERSNNSGGVSSIFPPLVSQIPVEEKWIKKMLGLFQEAIKEPSLPGYRINKARVRGGSYGRPGVLYKDGGRDLQVEESEMGHSSPVSIMEGARMAEDKAGEKNVSTQPAIRENFSETAVFLPQIPIINGKGSFTFQAPEQLTSWKIHANLITRDVKTGVLSHQTITQKDLMVRVEIPRFFREGDEGTIKGVVHNETDFNISGKLKLSVLSINLADNILMNNKTLVNNNISANNGTLGLKDLEKNINVKPHGMQAFSWPVRIPYGTGAYKVRLAASGNKVLSGNTVDGSMVKGSIVDRMAGKVADAEERELPILPSRQRLIESTVIVLNGNVSKEISLPSLANGDLSMQTELATLQVDPQLALTILNSIPFLVKYPHECVEQLLNRFVPLSIAHEFYKKYPAIAKATSKIPKRDTITPSWDRNDPRRLINLLETPWEEASKGQKSFWPVIDMLDPKIVVHEKEDALGKLIKAQLPNGAFPWFPGGEPDPYITLYVLAGFSEAKRYGVIVPEDVIRKALGYVNNEIPRRLKPNEADVALILYAAYVVTSFPPEAKLGYAFAKMWVDFADKHSNAMTQYGKAYAAYVYWRLGEKEKGNSYLERAMDGSREDEITGVYWTPEKNSWLWYNDTVEKHAFILRTLQTLRPNDKHIPGMVQWLIFNRKGTEWKSTKATASAIYALLDYMKSKGSLDKGDKFFINWGDTKEDIYVAPDEWLSTPIRWNKTPFDHARPTSNKVSIQTTAPVNNSVAQPVPSIKSVAHIKKEGPGIAFASLTHIYSTDQIPQSSRPGLINVSRTFYKREKVNDKYYLKPLQFGDIVHVGDEIEVQLTVTTKSQFEYVHLKDPKGAGFEGETLRSGWQWDKLSRYEEPRDSLTNFFISWLPHGEYILNYRVRPTTKGAFRLGAATIQSMYAPEFAAYSSSFMLVVKE